MKNTSFNLDQYLDTIPSDLWDRNLPVIQKRVTLDKVNFYNLSHFYPENCLSLLNKILPLVPQNWKIEKVDYIEGLQSSIPHLYAIYTLRPPVKLEKDSIEKFKHKILQTEDYTEIHHRFAFLNQLAIITVQKT